ncbi:SPL family radical SAM protein [Sphingobacterium yanglingense]|uniref:DNA repair photolyase n=1 Tax=Sphingobacterium yanglingense TaxID=1437280 RepID=A0A4R6WCN2_9SPHI|nr:radical SAM protein [Sphingobacterium yanglingense]TDQ77329.1 DNA repair photolyase [Sphingobacterium yanglingense]
MTQRISAKSILNKTKRRDPWFLDDYTLNPYSSCSFNCLYCYTRGSKYGINMAEKLTIKDNAVELLHKQLTLRARKKEYGIIVLSSATDPYLHLEESEQLTRRLLEVIHYHRFPVHVLTKSDLVVRDFDLLKAIDREAILPDDLQNKLQHKAILSFSFSTIDDTVARIFEPGATAPSARLNALRAARQQGLHCGVSLMPLLPFISDTTAQLDWMFQTFKELDISYIFPATLTLHGDSPSASKTLVLRAIAKHYPELLSKYERYFANDAQLPLYYRKAFSKKMRELCQNYQLPNTLFG